MYLSASVYYFFVELLIIEVINTSYFLAYFGKYILARSASNAELTRGIVACRIDKRVF